LWTIAALVGLAIIAGAAIGVVRSVMGVTARIAEDSAQRALFREVIAQLDAYANANGKYPNTITELSITNYQDGSTPQMLTCFQYTTDGNSYELGFISAICPEPYVTRKTLIKEESQQGGPGYPPQGVGSPDP